MSSVQRVEASTYRPSVLARIRRQHWGARLTVLGLAVFAIIWLLPVVYMSDVSLRLPQDVFDPAIILISITSVNYETIFAQNPLPTYFVNSIVVSVGSTLLVAIVAVCFSYGVSVLKIPYSRLLYAALLLTLMVPIGALVVPITIELKHFGWLNAYPGLIGPYAALGIPFASVILVSVMDDLPEELHEAAVMDGANAWQLLIHIVVPVVRPSLIFVVIWQFITSWNEFFLALTVMTDDTMKTLPLIPQQYAGVYLGNPGALFAILTLVAAPLIVLYLVVQRWFVAGLLEGAVKG